MLKEKPGSLLSVMALIVFIMLAIYLLTQDAALVGPL